MYTNYMAILESCLFANAEAIDIDYLSKNLDIPKSEIIKELHKLNDFYTKNNSSLCLIFVENTVQLSTKENFYVYIEKMQRVEEEILKPSHFEVLAIIACKKNPTKAEIDRARGVNSESTIMQLIRLGYIETIKLESDLRLNHYVVTPFFLKKFGFNSLEDLKRGEEFENLKDISL